MRYVKKIMADIGDLAIGIYQSARRNAFVYGLSAGTVLLPLTGCEPEEPELETEAEMSAYVEKTIGSKVDRVDMDLRIPTVLPLTETGWVTLNADYAVVGVDGTYLELVSIDDGLNRDENTAIDLALQHGLRPEVKRIYPGTAGEINDQLKAEGLK